MRENVLCHTSNILVRRLAELELLILQTLISLEDKNAS